MKHLCTVSLVIATAVFSHSAVAEIHPDVTKAVPKSITYDISGRNE